jgi:ribosomal protein S18 acetylase RimI-like enzyme
MLFDATLEYGKSNNYSGMVFQVLNWNEPAINFYKKYSPKFDNEWSNVSIEFKD